MPLEKGWTRQEVDGREVYERELGWSESAFVPANLADGVGDMFLHASITAPPEFMAEEHVVTAWAILRARHPVLGCVLRETSPTSWNFRYTRLTREEALSQAKSALTFCKSSRDDLISDHMDGERVLSTAHLSHLFISNTTPEKYDLLMSVPHFCGDGGALHATTHELMLLLSSPSDLQTTLESTLQNVENALTPSLEARLPQPRSKFQSAAQQIDYQLHLARQIGGHILPREPTSKRKTVVQEVCLTPQQTTRILKRCKEEKVSLSSLMFALVSMAWANILGVDDPSLPVMMYTAMNLRPHLSPSSASYWALGIGYLNIILPYFIPRSDPRGAIWQRARLARAQTTQLTTSPLMVSRSLCLAQERYLRMQGTSKPNLVPLHAPSKALCGLSLSGNLDNTYAQKSYAPDVTIHTVTTASRIRSGGMLFLEHSFQQKLWLHLCWDTAGFDAGVVARFWDELRRLTTDAAEF